MASGCGCKEVYIYPHITYPHSSSICSFFSSIPTFCSFKMFFVLVQVLFCNLYNDFSAQYKHLRASPGSHMKGCT